MTYITVENLSKSFSDKVILDNVSFSISKGEKIALVAQNGSGKSTLLKILVGKEEYDSGKISTKKDLRIAYLEQEPSLNPQHTVIEELFTSNSPIIQAVKLYEQSLQNPDDLEKMQIAFDEMNQQNAWEYEARVKDILTHLNLVNLHGKVATFSGGQKKRVALAKILIDTPDMLIIDEPTNHLDLEMIDWLENYLKSQEITLLMVTHDRYFLERVCNQIIELSKGKVYMYKGNYSYFLEKKTEREINENINIDKTKSLLRKELEWVRRGPSGRQTKAKGRVNRYYETKESLKQKNTTEKIKLEVASQYLGKKILEIHNLNKSFGDRKIVEQFNYSFNNGEKVGIIGKNGVGKTTFLNLILGNEAPDSGKIVAGETVKFGYYSQHGLEFGENERVIDAIKSVAEYIKLSDGFQMSASQMLERFLFTPLAQQNLISKLSGGERKRLNLLKVLMTSPNFLILDEPTNDFDILTLNILEEFLINFKGCLLIISHDRYFLDKVVDHVLVFRGEGMIQNFPGNYSDFREKEKEEFEVNSHEVEHKEAKSISTKESNELYREISKLESKVEKLNLEIVELGSNYEKIAEVAKKIKELEIELERKTEKWLELQ